MVLSCVGIALVVDLKHASKSPTLHQRWYREPSQSTFANDQLSNVINKDAPGWCIGTYWSQLVHNMSGKLPEQFAHPDPAFRYSSQSEHSAFNRAYDTSKPYFGVDSWTASNPSEGLAFGVVSDPSVAANLRWEDYQGQ
jgi:hypothetical protein